MSALSISSLAIAFCGPCQHDGPATPANITSWRATIEADRKTALEKIKWAGGVFDTAALKWTPSSYIQPQMHPYDRYFYDPQRGYTVDRFLNDLKLRYGGIDSLLMWPTYTNIGIDDRNQFDFFRTMPGGLDAVANVTKQLQAAGVRVLWPYNPWDTGTRREKIWKHHGDNSDAVTLATLIKQTGGDGFNGDTMNFVPKSFWDAALAVDHPLAFEPEIGGTDAALNWTTLGWGYWKFKNLVPVVDRFKFLSRGKFLTHACDRWNKNKTDNLQHAWFNGAGYESWENVWGTWNGIVPRDAEAIRRLGTLLRYYGGKVRILHSSLWLPHTPEVVPDLVYASRWPADASTLDKGIATLWTVVNRGGRDVSGQPILQLVPNSTSSRFFDCYRGVELKPMEAVAAAEDDSLRTLSFEMESQGYGCVVETIGAPSKSHADLLATMAKMTRTPLKAYSKAWTFLPQVMVPMGQTPLAKTAPKGMVHIPACTNYSLVTTGIEIEGDDAHGVDVQYPWERQPRKDHKAVLSLKPFYMDRLPVTNERYAEYLTATGYVPDDPANFLKFWNGSKTAPTAIAAMPVTYVSLNEARAFCAWAGGRLPHSYEWQYAAQGNDGRLYPWGTNRSAEGALPTFTSGNVYKGPEEAGAHSPAGDSPFGVADMVGNIWQYTDEFQDEHTRSVLLRGGSNYRPKGSNWYFPNKIELNTHNKYFLFDDCYERAATIGFRCVVDAPA